MVKSIKQLQHKGAKIQRDKAIQASTTAGLRLKLFAPLNLCPFVLRTGFPVPTQFPMVPILD